MAKNISKLFVTVGLFLTMATGAMAQNMKPHFLGMQSKTLKGKASTVTFHQPVGTDNVIVLNSSGSNGYDQADTSQINSISKYTIDRKAQTTKLFVYNREASGRPWMVSAYESKATDKIEYMNPVTKAGYIVPLQQGPNKEYQDTQAGMTRMGNPTTYTLVKPEEKSGVDPLKTVLNELKIPYAAKPAVQVQSANNVKPAAPIVQKTSFAAPPVRVNPETVTDASLQQLGKTAFGALKGNGMVHIYKQNDGDITVVSGSPGADGKLSLAEINEVNTFSQKGGVVVQKRTRKTSAQTWEEVISQIPGSANGIHAKTYDEQNNMTIDMIKNGGSIAFSFEQSSQKLQAEQSGGKIVANPLTGVTL